MTETSPPHPGPAGTYPPAFEGIAADLTRHLDKLETLLRNALAETASAGLPVTNIDLGDKMRALEATWSRALADISREMDLVSRVLERLADGASLDTVIVRTEPRAALRRIAELAQAFDQERERVLARMADTFRKESAQLKRHVEMLRRYQHQAPPERDGWHT